MTDLIGFAKRVDGQLKRSNREPIWAPDEASRYMQEIETRRANFTQIAARLNEAIVQPRLETLAGFFPNACVVKDEPLGHCASWFGYSERFPASTKVAFAIEHDIRYEKIIVRYDVSMTPRFIKFVDHDALTLPGKSEDELIATWVEERLLEFLDAYLRIDRGTLEFVEDAATDPVCGMRIGRSAAAASECHRGHPYFFCSASCQKLFVENPSAYVEVRPM